MNFRFPKAYVGSSKSPLKNRLWVTHLWLSNFGSLRWIFSVISPKKNGPGLVALDEDLDPSPGPVVGTELKRLGVSYFLLRQLLPAKTQQ